MMCDCWVRIDAPYPVPLMQLRAGVPQCETSGPQGNLTAVVLYSSDGVAASRVRVYSCSA